MPRPQFPPPPILDSGWYADPTGRYEARYWDGLKWTGHVSHYGATGTDPILRARFDRLWIRMLGKLILWVLVLGLLFMVIKMYWPDGGGSDTNEKKMSESIGLSSEDGILVATGIRMNKGGVR